MWVDRGLGGGGGGDVVQNLHTSDLGCAIGHSGLTGVEEKRFARGGGGFPEVPPNI